MTMARWEELYAESFRQFIKEIEQWKPDYYVPVARKSCKLLKSLNLPTDSSRIFYRKYFEFNADLDIQGKKIAVIDDSCHHRATLASHRKFFEEKGAQVKTFAFAGLNLRASRGEFSYDEKAKVLHGFTRADYNEYLLQQDEFLQIQGIPLDIDHLVLQFELPIDNGQIETLLTRLQNYGYVYQIDQGRLPPFLMKFTLDQPYFDESKYLPIDSELNIEGVRKIRFFVNKRLSKLYAIPMIFPALSSKFCFPHKCPLKKPIICIHKLFNLPSKSKKISETMCFHCLSLNLSAALAKSFFRVITTEFSPKFNVDSLIINPLDYQRFFGLSVAEKIIDGTLKFIQSKEEVYENAAELITTCRVPQGFIVGACSLKIIYLLRSFLKRQYEKRKAKLKTSLDVHFSLSFSQILKKYNEMPPWYLSQNLDFLCDHGILTPSIEQGKGVWLRKYRTGETDEVFRRKLKRTELIIPFTITTVVEQLKPEEQGLRAFFLTKLLANFVLDHKAKSYDGLHFFEEEPNHFGTDIFCEELELTGGEKAKLEDCHLLGDKYYKEEVYFKGKEYRIYKARPHWDNKFNDYFEDGLKSELLLYFDLLIEIAKRGGELKDISTGPLLSLSVNRTPELFLRQIHFNVHSWHGVFNSLLKMISHTEKLDDNKMIGRIRHLASIKSQPLVKLSLYYNFPNLLKTLDSNFLAPLRYKTLYGRIRSSISRERVPKITLDRIEELGKLQNALSDLFLASYSAISKSSFLLQDIQLVPFDKAWKIFSIVYEKAFAHKLDEDLKLQCLSKKEDFLDVMTKLEESLNRYFIEILKPSTVKPLIEQISNEVYQKAAKAPVDRGVQNPVFIIVDMRDSKNKYIELGATGYADLAAFWSTAIVSQFDQFYGHLFDRGAGDKLFIGFFPDIPRMIAAVARLFETIMSRGEKMEGWPIHLGAAVAETLDLEKRNNSYLKLDVAAKCCDLNRNEKYLFVTEDFVKMCPEKLRKYFCPLEPAVYVDEKDMKGQTHSEKVFSFLWESYVKK